MKASGKSKDMPKKVDLLIIGLGPAGVSCAIEAKRCGLSILAVGDEPIGGLVPAARRIDNLPGLPGISGAELARRLAEQIQALEVPSLPDRVTSLAKNSTNYSAGTSDGLELTAKSVCLACGTRPAEWTNFALPAGVHRDLRNIAKNHQNLRGRSAVVVGGGEAALDTALSLQDLGAAVQLWMRNSVPRSGGRLLNEAYELELCFCPERHMVALTGGPGAWKITDQNGEMHQTHELMLCIGREPRDELRAMLPAECPGLFAAGDLIRGHDRYIASAMGDGQRAAIAAAAYLANQDGRKI
ncbi:MAG: NAD(P)/FAD-dependent oxidoreductase [Deltaproteobacteria bacterium]|nr:NAD(P)/FAD-dependent oxidoreductase [Deltaproteobacteria bacterium]